MNLAENGQRNDLLFQVCETTSMRTAAYRGIELTLRHPHSLALFPPHASVNHQQSPKFIIHFDSRTLPYTSYPDSLIHDYNLI